MGEPLETLRAATLRVLLVGSDPALVRASLQREDGPRFEICCARGARRALAILRRMPIDVVLFDHAHPGQIDAGFVTTLLASVPPPAIVLLGGASVPHELAPLAVFAGDGVCEHVPYQCLLGGCGLGAELLRRALIHACERRHAEQRLADLALRDPLTGLPNRRALATMLAVALARARRHGRRLGVLFIDIDRFKAINDHLGHAAGDSVLCEVASRLRAGLRESDVVARLAGDEFVAVVEDLASAQDAHRVAAKIHGMLAPPIRLGHRSVRTSVTIGVALGPTRAHPDAEAMIARADAAMYRAKRHRVTATVLPGDADLAVGRHELTPRVAAAPAGNGAGRATTRTLSRACRRRVRRPL